MPKPHPIALALKSFFLQAVILAVLGGAVVQATHAASPEDLAKDSGLAPLAANREILRQPIADRKRVIAHFMTGMVPTPKAEVDHWMNPALYNPHGPTEAVGGEFQTIPMSVLVKPDLMPLEEAALREMQTAIKLGVDGFDFYYPFGPDEAFRDQYDRIIRAFFDAAEANHLDFKLTLCFCAADGVGMSAKEKIEVWSRHLRGLIQDTQGNDHWLKTPDGRYLFYTWIADGMADSWLDGKQWMIRDHPALLEGVAQSLEQVAQQAGVRGAFIYHLQFPGDSKFVDKALDYFPAVTGWCSVEDLNDWRSVAARCKQRHRRYTQEIHPDFYTSKVYPKAGGGLIFDPRRVAELGPKQIERRVQVLGLSEIFRRELDMAVRLDTPLINLTTWNDYPEGTHLAPEINHNFGFSLLLRHYKAIWQQRPDTAPEDVAIVFFKKYPSDIKPDPFDVALHTNQRVGPDSIEDQIEIITILKNPGTLKVNNQPEKKVGAGLVVTHAPMQPGPVRVKVTRDREVVAELVTPQWITRHPYRTDRLTYSFSSRFQRIYQSIFGSQAEVYTAREYAEDADGSPLWQKPLKAQVTPADNEK